MSTHSLRLLLVAETSGYANKWGQGPRVIPTGLLCLGSLFLRFLTSENLGGKDFPALNFSQVSQRPLSSTMC